MTADTIWTSRLAGIRIQMDLSRTLCDLAAEILERVETQIASAPPKDSWTGEDVVSEVARATVQDSELLPALRIALETWVVQSRVAQAALRDELLSTESVLRSVATSADRLRSVGRSVLPLLQSPSPS